MSDDDDFQDYFEDAVTLIETAIHKRMRRSCYNCMVRTSNVGDTRFVFSLLHYFMSHGFMVDDFRNVDENNLVHFRLSWRFAQHGMAATTRAATGRARRNVGG